jgi:hypothetical protein
MTRPRWFSDVWDMCYLAICVTMAECLLVAAAWWMFA